MIYETKLLLILDSNIFFLFLSFCVIHFFLFKDIKIFSYLLWKYFSDDK